MREAQPDQDRFNSSTVSARLRPPHLTTSNFYLKKKSSCSKLLGCGPNISFSKLPKNTSNEDIGKYSFSDHNVRPQTESTCRCESSLLFWTPGPAGPGTSGPEVTGLYLGLFHRTGASYTVYPETRNWSSPSAVPGPRRAPRKCQHFCQFHQHYNCGRCCF